MQDSFNINYTINNTNYLDNKLIFIIFRFFYICKIKQCYHLCLYYRY